MTVVTRRQAGLKVGHTALALAVVVVGCSSSSPTMDASVDGAPVDGALDAMVEGGPTDAFTGIACRMLLPFGVGTGACTFTWDQCSDGRVYQVNCPGGMPSLPCECRIQDDAGVTSGKQIAQNVCNLPSTQWAQAINQGCGWNIGAK